MTSPNLSHNLSARDAALLARAELERRRRNDRPLMPVFRNSALWAQTATDREWILSGPSETGKTFATMYRLHMLLSQTPNARATILRKVRATLFGTALETWARVIRYGGIPVEEHGGNRPNFYTYPNGARVFIGGLDNANKILSGERDFIYVNQAEELSETDWEILTTRTTGRGSVSTTPMLFGDCNPADPDHWIVKRSNDGHLTLKTTQHEDNPSLWANEEWTAQGVRSLSTLDALTGARYLRLRLGMWVYSEDDESFIPDIVIWDNCRKEMPPLNDNQPMVLGLDAAVNNDCFAIVGVTRDPENQDHLAVRFSRVWYPDGQKLDYEMIENEIRNIVATYNVVQIAYDPYQVHYLAQRLAEVVWCDPFNQGALRLESDAALRQLIMQRRIIHDGQHPELRAHMLMAGAKMDAEGHKLRIVKRQSGHKIDAVVALSMACYKALDLNLW